MKVAKIVEQTREYKRLQGLIDNIESALENLGKVDQSKVNPTTGGTILYVGGDLYINGWGTGPNEQIQTVDVSLNSDVSKLIHEDLRDLLRKCLWTLKAEQDALEVC